MTAELAWRSIPLPAKELSLARVLRCGQSFRWKNVNDVWSFATQNQVILLKQDDEKIYYASLDAPSAKVPHSSATDFITDYFNLDVKLEQLYQTWAEVEARFTTKSKIASFSYFPGIRMLRQEPWETVVLFICSSNNNVKRISKMCDALCVEYGSFVAEYDGVRYFLFPPPSSLAAPEVEARLRELGFGYRARYIQQTAQMFEDDEWPEITMDALYALRSQSYDDAHAFLLQLCGVGPKVADCICLMALDKHDVVPVDTHVLQIAVRDYKFKGAKTMSAKAYHEVRKYLQSLFGEYAGWAQLVMFAADLSDLNNGINQKNGEIIKHEVLEIVRVELSEGSEMVIKTQSVILSKRAFARSTSVSKRVKSEA